MTNYAQLARQNRIAALQTMKPRNHGGAERPRPIFVSNRKVRDDHMAIRLPNRSLADMPTFYSC